MRDHMEREKLITLVERLQDGKNEAMTEIYDAFYKDIYYYVFKIVNHEELATDLTQETFIEIYQKIHTLQEPTAFVNWSRTIAYHKCTAYFRKKRELLADEDEDGNTIFDSIAEDREEFIPEEALDKEELKIAIHKMINSLPEEQRASIMMRYFDEMSVKEIAEIQGVTEGTVKSRLNYGRKAIKQSVEDYEKKNGIKLHCTGIVPLLLWLFKDGKVAGAATVGKSVAVTTQLGTIGKTGSKFARVFKSFFAKKAVAVVTATTIVAGGVTAGVLLKGKDAPVVQEEICMEWSGYGSTVVSINSMEYFYLSIEEMDDEHVKGHLEITRYYNNVIHDTDFEGEGTVVDNTVQYNIKFSDYINAEYFSIEEWRTGYTEIILIYDKDTEEFSFDDYYNVVMTNVLTQEKNSVVLATNQKWQGEGSDTFCWPNPEGHFFELDIQKMTDHQIKGTIYVSKNGVVEHESTFTGRGCRKENSILYEIKLDTPRVEKDILEHRLDVFWIEYHCDTKEFTDYDILQWYKYTLRLVD